MFGKADSAYNMGYLGFIPNADSTLNKITLGFHTADDLMVIQSNGNVGIGTTAPAGKLHVVQDGGGLSTYFDAYRNDSGQVEIAGRFSRGSAASPSVVQNADDLLHLTAFGYDGAVFKNAASIRFGVDATPGTNDMPGNIRFLTTPDGSQAMLERVRIQSDGNVGIGTTGPGALLDIGTAGTSLGKVRLSGNTSGNVTLQPNAIAGTDIVLTLPATTGTLYVSGGTDVAFADGGTGISSWTQYLIPYAATTTSIGQIAIGTAGQVLTSNGAGAAPTFQAAAGGDMSYANTRSFMGSFSRDTTAASGTQAITGVGFAPTRITVFMAQAGSGETSWGLQSAAAAGTVIQRPNIPDFSYDAGLIIDWEASGSYYGTITTWGADGFTVTWTKNSTPSGTIQCYFLAER